MKIDQHASKQSLIERKTLAMLREDIGDDLDHLMSAGKGPGTITLVQQADLEAGVCETILFDLQSYCAQMITTFKHC